MTRTRFHRRPVRSVDLLQHSCGVRQSRIYIETKKPHLGKKLHEVPARTPSTFPIACLCTRLILRIRQGRHDVIAHVLTQILRVHPPFCVKTDRNGPLDHLSVTKLARFKSVRGVKGVRWARGQEGDIWQMKQDARYLLISYIILSR